MVVLCTAMEARKDSRDIGRTLGINQGSDGFFLEEHPKLGPLNTATDGVFIAGACQGPKDIPDTVAQASGAASKALLLATRGEVEIPSTVSYIDPDICAGCMTCIAFVPTRLFHLMKTGGYLLSTRPFARMRFLFRILSQRGCPGEAFQGKTAFRRTGRGYGCH